jgi:hypothetical protein
VEDAACVKRGKTREDEMRKIMQLIEKYKIYGILPVIGIMLSGPQSLLAQDDLEYVAEPTVVLEDQAGTELLGAEELAELVGPIALYPDDLVAIVLPAATYPLQIAQAANFLERLENDASLEPDEDWDDSIVALLNYPEVVTMMNDDLTWTWQLGNAVLNQQADVVQAIGGFRDQAYAAGNLKSDDYQNVVVEEDAIEITPVDPEVIYVPYYEPAQVVVVQRAPVYHYYPYAYPVYYYPYPYGYSFSSGYFWGVTTAFTIGWHSHYIHQHHYYYPSHPYYSHYYYPRNYTRYYPPGRNPVRPAPYRANYDRHDRYSGGDRWQSQNHQGSRPVRWSDSGSSGSRTASRVDGNVARGNSNRNRSTAQISSEYRNALAQDSSLRQVRGSDSPATRGTDTRGAGWKERDLAASASRNQGSAVSNTSHDQRSWRRPGKENATTSQAQRQDTAPATQRNNAATNTGARDARVASTRNAGDTAQLQRQLRQGLEQDTRQRQVRAQGSDTRSQAARVSSDSSRSRSSNADTSRSAQIGNQVRQSLQQDTQQRSTSNESGNTGGRAIANQGRSQPANRSTARETTRNTREQSAAPQVRSQPAPQVRSQPAPQVKSQPAPQSQPEVRSESRPAPRQESRRESSGSKSRSSSSKQKPRSKPR